MDWDKSCTESWTGQRAWGVGYGTQHYSHSVPLFGIGAASQKRYVLAMMLRVFCAILFCRASQKRVTGLSLFGIEICGLTRLGECVCMMRILARMLHMNGNKHLDASDVPRRTEYVDIAPAVANTAQLSRSNRSSTGQ